MDQRTGEILAAIIKEYVDTASPVGSFKLVNEYEFPFSSATIRNEMMLLENLGYVYSPHTSAGRVPTEKGYRYFVENLAEEGHVSRREAEAMLKKILAYAPDFERMLSSASKVIAELTGSAGVSGANGIVYKSGIANLLRQPEFKSENYAIGVAEIFDNLEQVVKELPLEKEVQIFIGHENPVGKSANCSMLISNIYTPYGTKGILGVIGPTRMSYERNLEIINIIKKILMLGDFEDRRLLR